jgi:hypothetical protein
MHQLNKSTIPDQVKEVVIRTMRQADFTWPDLQVMFYYWNRTYPNDRQDINCKGCRTRVVSKLRYYVQQEGSK